MATEAGAVAALLMQRVRFWPSTCFAGLGLCGLELIFRKLSGSSNGFVGDLSRFVLPTLNILKLINKLMCNLDAICAHCQLQIDAVPQLIGAVLELVIGDPKGRVEDVVSGTLTPIRHGVVLGTNRSCSAGQAGRAMPPRVRATG